MGSGYFWCGWAEFMEYMTRPRTRPLNWKWVGFVMNQNASIRRYISNSLLFFIRCICINIIIENSELLCAIITPSQLVFAIYAFLGDVLWSHWLSPLWIHIFFEFCSALNIQAWDGYWIWSGCVGHGKQNELLLDMAMATFTM